jgi:hypothetical protein
MPPNAARAQSSVLRMSPLTPLRLTDAQKEVGGVPQTATHVSFVYPNPHVSLCPYERDAKFDSRFKKEVKIGDTTRCMVATHRCIVRDVVTGADRRDARRLRREHAPRRQGQGERQPGAAGDVTARDSNVTHPMPGRADLQVNGGALPSARSQGTRMFDLYGDLDHVNALDLLRMHEEHAIA